MLRYLFALPVSIFTGMLLFSFMAWIVDNGGIHKIEPSSVLQFDMVMTERNTDVQRRQRSVPKPPKMPPVPSTASLTRQLSQPQIQPIPYDLPLVSSSINTGINNIPISAAKLGNLSASQMLVSVYRAEPDYPSDALRRHIEGYVIVQFDINERGKPINIQVIASKPQGVFNGEALRAVRRWKYQPQMENGKAFVVTEQRTKLEFRIAK